MNKIFKLISILPALLVLPAMADGYTEINERQVLQEDYTFDGVQIKDISNSATGGAILSNNKLIIKNSEIKNNTGGAAGALYDNSLTAFKKQTGNYSVSIDSSYFVYNTAGDFGAVAIFSPNSLVSNSQFAHNKATANYANLGDGAGALMLGSESQTVVYRVSFDSNESGTVGGAIATRPINYWLDTNYSGKGTNSSAGAKVDITYSQFFNNVAGTRGGAFFNSFYNSKAKEGYAYVSDSTFVSNRADKGGAVFVEGWTDSDGGNAKLWIDNSTFSKNDANMGGAIYNESELVIKDTRNYKTSGFAFKENTATKGGAIYNAGTLEIENASFHLNTATGNSGAIAQHDVNSVLKLKNVNFVENSADWGGAMVARGNVDINGGSFEGNSSNDGGGAIYLATLINKGHKLSIDGTTFINNSTAGVDLDGGGAIGSFSDLVLKNAKFDGNHVDGLASNGGGAIFMGSVSTNDLSNVEFNSNTSATNGGAISMRFVDLGNNKDATLDIANTKFIGNHADNFGGAIYNTLHNDKNDSGFVSISDTSFNSNTALNGGAIYNETYGTTDQIGGNISLSNVKFTNNSASANGGAIYNAGTLVLSGTNEFSGNKAQNSANDIYNVGDLTIANGTTTIDGGIAGAGDLTIADGSTLNIGSAKINQNNITLNGTLIADLFADGDAFLTATQSFEGDGNLSVAVEKVGTYNIFGDKVFANAKNQIISSVFDLTWSVDGKSFDASLKSADKIVEDTGAAKETVNAVLNIASSDSEQLKDLSLRMQEKLATHSKDDIAAVEDATKSVHPETESVVQSVATSVQTTVGNLAATRMSLPTIGRAGGDIKPTGAGFWANGLYNYTNQKDSFDGYTRGFAIGMDGVFNKVVTVGTGYSYSHSDIDSAHRDTEIDSYTMFVYGQYKPNKWYANAVLNYTISQYSETGSALGIGVKSDYDVHSFGGRIATGYDFANGVTPELGLRYTHIDADDYKNNLGVKHSLEDTDYMTLTLGGKYTRNFNTKHTHISFAPEFHGLLKYDVMSDDQVAVVTMPGVNSYSISGEKLSKFGAEFGVGLTMRYYNADWTLDYDLDVRDEYISHTGRIKWRYNF